MMEVPMETLTLGLLALCLVIGCSLRVPMLDEEIATQPDEWSLDWKSGASSNNWVLLDRVVAVEDALEVDPSNSFRLASDSVEHLRLPWAFKHRSGM